MKAHLRGNHLKRMKREVVIFKGSKEGIQIFCDEVSDWSEILEYLKSRLDGKEGTFFKGASVIIHLGARTLSSQDIAALWEILSQAKMRIKGIVTETDKEITKGALISNSENRQVLESENINVLPTLIIKKNVRSGQDVTFAGNVIIFGDVNPGAEIKATGFVMVLGDLRGTVHGGAQGDQKAWVSALRMQPTQLRIAEYITRAPDEEPLQPEVAQIDKGIIVVRGIHTY